METGKLYYSISEVAELINEETTTLRYWETQFKQLRPQKGDGGQRRYTARDIAIARTIQQMLRTQKLTIAGAQKKLSKANRMQATDCLPLIDRLAHIKTSLQAIQKELNLFKQED